MPDKSRRELEELEEQHFLAALRAQGKVIEAASESIALPPGVTHVLVRKHGRKDRLVERRKSLF